MTERVEDAERDRAAGRIQVDAAAGALVKLQAELPGLAAALAGVTQLLAEEAVRTPRFARGLEAALAAGAAPAPASRSGTGASRGSAPSRRAKRQPGPIDPFAVYLDSGESGLQDALAALDTEQLKDIVAEHAMDYDKRAMRWRSPDRLRERISERVVARATKGDAFRT
ncbi:hypothetical protein OG921_21625 [Aldersonia sp. NBC_00410]|uniref:hypothetical protein n=1 Tax=Aldersonia sp. NBC_00410 TaxID=2975954 RepID=UPI0022589208|nr:hypothetical protein [Aldersonia sp. NBC_00410]MCX5045770.1 hypothetical protein [Aldersonia sp. NBC_00410]